MVNLIDALGAAEASSADKITIYVPSRDRHGNVVDFEPWVSRAMEILSNVGGGATRFPSAQGAWQNPESGNLIVEEVTLVYAFVDGDTLVAWLPEIRQFLHEMGHALDQGEVVVEINEALYKMRKFDV